MARSIKIKEEQVTKALMQWLDENGWDIVCFDFPQSGTGRVLHPSNTTSKTEGAIIPDIVAIKNDVVLDFENKDRFVESDFEKIDFLRNTNLYDDSLKKLLGKRQYKSIYYGIGMPYSERNYSKAQDYLDLVDFVVYLKVDGKVLIDDNIGGII